MGSKHLPEVRNLVFGGGRSCIPGTWLTIRSLIAVMHGSYFVSVISLIPLLISGHQLISLSLFKLSFIHHCCIVFWSFFFSGYC